MGCFGGPKQRQPHGQHKPGQQHQAGQHRQHRQHQALQQSSGNTSTPLDTHTNDLAEAGRILRKCRRELEETEEQEVELSRLIWECAQETKAIAEELERAVAGQRKGMWGRLLAYLILYSVGASTVFLPMSSRELKRSPPGGPAAAQVQPRQLR